MKKAILLLAIVAVTILASCAHKSFYFADNGGELQLAYDSAKWAHLYMVGDIDSSSFESLLLGQKDLLKMDSLKREGLALVNNDLYIRSYSSKPTSSAGWTTNLSDYSVQDNSRPLLNIFVKYRDNDPRNEIDSVLMYVKKSQIKWLNDTVAVVYKPQ